MLVIKHGLYKNIFSPDFSYVDPIEAEILSLDNFFYDGILFIDSFGVIPRLKTIMNECFYI